MNEPYILVHREVVDGKNFDTYEWKGDPRKPIEIDHYLNRGIKDFPWKLKEIDRNFATGRITYVRTDQHIPAIYFVAKVFVTKQCKLFFCRFMATLNIWNLAHTPPGCEYRLSDIRKR